MKAYYHTNKERIRERTREYRRKYMKEYYQTHKKEMNARRERDKKLKKARDFLTEIKTQGDPANILETNKKPI